MPDAQRIESGLAYIRQHYGVPARLGGVVRFEGQRGVIKDVVSHYLRVQLDGEWSLTTLHPTWHVTYDDATPPLASERT